MTGLEMLLLIVVAGYTTKALVTDGAAAVRGHTPPSQKRWEQRQKQRANRGSTPAAEPGYLGRIWRNATAEWAERNAHRHAARMDYIAEREPHKSAKWKQRKLARAEKWDTARARAAERGGLAWQQIKDGAGTVRQAVDEHRAHRKAATGRLADAEPPTADPAGESSAEQVDPAPPDPEGEGRAGGTVLPFRREQQYRRTDPYRVLVPGAVLHVDGPQSASGLGNRQRNHGTDAADDGTETTPASDRSTDSESEKETTPMAQQPTGEIQNLAQATAFCEQMASYLDGLHSQFEPVQAQAKQAGQDLGQAPQIFENGQSALTAHGFGTQVTGPMASASESASTAGEAIRAAEEAITTAMERIAEATAQARAAGQQLAPQQGLAEQVQSHQASGVGVASSTEFYSNA